MKKSPHAPAPRLIPPLPESWLRYLDRYTRKGRHHDAPGTVSGYELRAWLKARLDHWDEVRSRQGIRAAIALGY